MQVCLVIVLSGIGHRNVGTVWKATSVINLPVQTNTDFFLNNQPDALIIQIYSVIKLHVSGNLSAHHQEFSTVHSALVSFMQVFDDCIQAESG